jgi:hypothetical protein
MSGAPMRCCWAIHCWRALTKCTRIADTKMTLALVVVDEVEAGGDLRGNWLGSHEALPADYVRPRGAR